MKKTWGIAGAIVVIAAGYTAASWYIGQQVEDFWTQQLPVAQAELKKQGLQGEFRLEDYQRGIFCSTGRMVLELELVPEEVATTIGMVDGRIKLSFQTELEHGPLPWGQITSGSLRPILFRGHYALEKDARFKTVYDFFEETSPLTSDVAVGFDGRARGTAHISSGKWGQGGSTVAFSGADGPLEFQYDKDGTIAWLKAHFLAPQLSVDGGTAVLAKQLEYDIDQKRSDVGLQVGGGRFSVAETSGVAAGRYKWALQKLVFEGGSNAESNKAISFGGGYSLGGLKINDLDFGGGELIRVDFSPMNGEKLLALQKALNQAQGDHGLTPELAVALAELLEDDLRLSFRQRWKAEGGEYNADMSVAFQNLNLIVSEPAVWENLSLPQKVSHFVKTIDGAASVPLPLLVSLSSNGLQLLGSDSAQADKEAKSMVETSSDEFVKRSLAKRDGDRLITVLNYANNVFVLNGQELSPPEFWALLGYDGNFDDEVDEDEGDE